MEAQNEIQQQLHSHKETLNYSKACDADDGLCENLAHFSATSLAARKQFQAEWSAGSDELVSEEDSEEDDDFDDEQSWWGVQSCRQEAQSILGHDGERGVTFGRTLGLSSKPM
eukprot:scaffold156792_cov69-Attheya_sp.AAC.3